VVLRAGSFASCASNHRRRSSTSGRLSAWRIARLASGVPRDNQGENRALPHL
jgi:hypothetical protein